MLLNHHTEVTCHSAGNSWNTFVFCGQKEAFSHDLPGMSRTATYAFLTDSVIIQNLWMNFAQESNSLLRRRGCLPVCPDVKMDVPAFGSYLRNLYACLLFPGTLLRHLSLTKKSPLPYIPSVNCIPLIRKLGKRQCFRQINVCQFIETNVFVSVAIVMAREESITI